MATTKRHAPITFTSQTGKDSDVRQDDAAKKSKGNSDQKVYTPPSGKYSGKVQNYSNNRNNRNNSRNTGGFRGNKSKNFRRY